MVQILRITSAALWLGSSRSWRTSILRAVGTGTRFLPNIITLERVSVSLAPPLSWRPHLLTRFTAQENAENVKALTKSEILEYYKKYIDIESPTRAKLVVQLFAQGNAQSKEKMDALLGTTLAGETAETKEAVTSALMQPELRGDTATLHKYLSSDLKLAEDKIEAILTVARDPATEPKETEEGEAVNGDENGNGVSNGADGAANKKKPILITDVRAFKASLVASAGARPARDITEYEEVNGKL